MSARKRQPRSLTAFDIACRWLARAARSSAEIRARLGRLGFSEAAVDQALGQLHALNFVDDHELARARAHALAARGYGDAWIERDLEQRGVGGDDVADALASLAPEMDRAREWLDRRRPGGRAAGRVAWRSLCQRGFRSDTAESALGVTRGEDTDDPAD